MLKKVIDLAQESGYLSLFFFLKNGKIWHLGAVFLHGSSSLQDKRSWTRLPRVDACLPTYPPTPQPASLRHFHPALSSLWICNPCSITTKFSKCKYVW